MFKTPAELREERRVRALFDEELAEERTAAGDDAIEHQRLYAARARAASCDATAMGWCRRALRSWAPEKIRPGHAGCAGAIDLRRLEGPRVG